MFGKGLDRDLNVKGGCGIKPSVSRLWKTDWHFRTDQSILLLPVHALFIITDCFLAPQVTPGCRPPPLQVNSEGKQ